jgi:hypothetical protein
MFCLISQSLMTKLCLYEVRVMAAMGERWGLV